jgi:hypothetical protein
MQEVMMTKPGRHFILLSLILFSAIARGELEQGTEDLNDNPAHEVIAAGNITIPQQDPNKILHPLSALNTARITFYDPSVNSRLEGGNRDAFGETINSIEDAERNGRPVTIAADNYGSFGRQCNRESKRCLVLIHTAGFDTYFPAYRKRFPHLPKNTFLGIVEDTGGAFAGTNGKRMDLATRNRSFARSVPGGFNDHVTWTQVQNPCGSAEAGRQCDLTTASLAPQTLAMLNISNVQ